MTGFSSPADFEFCRRLHRRYGTTYYFSTLRFPREQRRRVHAIYGFVRVPDEWVDNPGGLQRAEVARRLDDWQAQLEAGLRGICPDHPAMRAFCDVMVETGIPIEEPVRFLDAMRMDLEVTRYPTYDDLRSYMRGSASAVGIMMCHAFGAPTDADTLARASSLGEAMQLTNFLRDVGEDGRRGRVYLPLEDLDRFGVDEASLTRGCVDDRFRALMRFEIARARALYADADAGIERLPTSMQAPVRLARVLYSRILDAIEANDHDVFTRRARTGRLEKLGCLCRTVWGGRIRG